MRRYRGRSSFKRRRRRRGSAGKRRFARRASPMRIGYRM